MRCRFSRASFLPSCVVAAGKTFRKRLPVRRVAGKRLDDRSRSSFNPLRISAAAAVNQTNHREHLNSGRLDGETKSNSPNETSR
jgi:hypothetical protein